MNDRRRLPRKIADEIIEVYDLNTGRHLGRIVNLSREGMMLISPDPMESDLVFQLQLVLEHPQHGTRKMQFGAESLWCSEANRTRYYWTGFHIIDIDLEIVEFIESLAEGWSIGSIDGDIH